MAAPFAYELYECPHDCGHVGGKCSFERVAEKEYSRDVYRCPRCEGMMKI